jgi:Fe-S cluster assembly protein SufD
VVDGVFIGRSGQLLDHHTNLLHLVGETQSEQLYKGILADESRGVFNGRVVIAKGASGSNSAQLNKNLLLSKRVEIDTKPQLEIENDDVKAAHGAAIGRLDPEHLFYLQSRGIGLSQAVEVLARGFAFESIDKLESDRLREIGRIAIGDMLSGINWEGL